MKNLDEIIDQLTPIEIDLDWDGGTGNYINGGYEIENPDILIVFALEASQEIKIEEATMHNPIEFSTIQQGVRVANIELSIKGDLQDLGTQDYATLMRGLIKSVEL